MSDQINEAQSNFEKAQADAAANGNGAKKRKARTVAPKVKYPGLDGDMKLAGGNKGRPQYDVRTALQSVPGDFDPDKHAMLDGDCFTTGKLYYEFRAGLCDQEAAKWRQQADKWTPASPKVKRAPRGTGNRDKFLVLMDKMAADLAVLDAAGVDTTKLRATMAATQAEREKAAADRKAKLEAKKAAETANAGATAAVAG